MVKYLIDGGSSGGTRRRSTPQSSLGSLLARIGATSNPASNSYKKSYVSIFDSPVRYTPPKTTTSYPVQNRTWNPLPTTRVNTGPSAAELARREAEAARQRANEAAKKQDRKENEQTANLVKGEHKKLAGFGKQRDTKLSNISQAFGEADKLLLTNYGSALEGLQGSAEDNQKSEADSTFSNIVNAARERQDLVNEAATLNAGETDLMRVQLQALRNFDANQGEVNRAFYDTQRSVNNSITGLNSDTSTSRANLWSKRESDRESAWSNYYNQVADTWTQIQNIENSNNNVDSESGVGYERLYKNAADEAAKAVGSSYKQEKMPEGWTAWDGKGTTDERRLNTNRAAVVTFNAPQQRAEGATLRGWGA